MPFARPTLTTLQNNVASDIAAALSVLQSSPVSGLTAPPSAGTLLRFSNLSVTGRAQAGLSNLHYGYLDWIAKQAVPFTCTDEFLEGWAALKGVYRNPAVSASGSLTFVGQVGTPLPIGTAVVRSDGVGFTTTSAGVVLAAGTVTVTATANVDTTGLTGAFGNTVLGTLMTLSKSISGIQSNGSVSSAFAGGADLESNDSLRSRMLATYQAPPQGGAQSDYVTLAMQAPGVTRAWCSPNGFGVGTVVMYLMMDVTRSAFSGFPQGLSGAATAETRSAPATGDLLTVANFMYTSQPAVGLLYAVAPAPQACNFSIQGLAAALQPAATAAISGVLQAQGSPGGTVPFGSVWAAVASAAAGSYFALTPSTDVVCATGHLPVLGTVTYS